MTYRVVDTDNLGGDWPDERFVGPGYDDKNKAEAAASRLNERFGGDHAPRFYKVVEEPYDLLPGFES